MRGLTINFYEFSYLEIEPKQDFVTTLMFVILKIMSYI